MCSSLRKDWQFGKAVIPTAPGQYYHIWSLHVQSPRKKQLVLQGKSCPRPIRTPPSFPAEGGESRSCWALACRELLRPHRRLGLAAGIARRVWHFADRFRLSSSAYNWTYAVMQMPSGMLLDRFGLRTVGRIGTFLWSVACFASAAATGLVSFIAARFLLGIGESPTFPGNAKAIGYWFPKRERSLPTAITDAAAKFSAGVGVPFQEYCCCVLAGARALPPQVLSAFSISFCFIGSTATRDVRIKVCPKRSGNLFCRAEHGPRMPLQFTAKPHSDICYLGKKCGGSH